MLPDSLETLRVQTLLKGIFYVGQVLVQFDDIEVWVHIIYGIAVVGLLRTGKTEHLKMSTVYNVGIAICHYGRFYYHI